MKKAIVFVLVSLLVINSHAQMESPYAKKGMVIIQSTKSYAAAKKTALQAAKKLSLKLDFRGLSPAKGTGLSFSKKACEAEGGYPCYIARGRYEDNEFVSIEYSDAIEGFAKGYYVVITACGDKSITDPALTKARKFYKDAYAKTTNVYMGCMH
jgi:hypothetical protein